MRTADDGAEPEIGIALQRGGAIGYRADPTDAVIETSVVIEIDHAPVGISHADCPAVVGPAGHLAPRVLNSWCRDGVHGSGTRLVLGDELAQPIINLLHLVDDVSGAGGIEAGV